MIDQAKESMQQFLDELHSIEQSSTCQACFVHHEHNRCTGENTLGTRKCLCAENNHWQKP